MSGLLLTFLAVILSSLGARDQATVAALAERQGQRAGLLVVALLCCGATAALAAWAGSRVLLLPEMIAKARLIFAAIALAFAGGEQLLFGGGLRKPEEPTLSLGAFGIVLLAHQVTDAARFLIFAVAVASAAPVPAGIGGAAGAGVALGAAWLAPEIFAKPWLRTVRRIVGAVLLLVAAVLAVQALG